MKQDWRNCNGACRLCVSPCCPFRKEPMLGSNEESKKDIEVDSLGNPICPHQTHPHYAIIARCIGCPKSEDCPDRDKIMEYKNKPRMDINELKRKKRLLETKIDTLIATFLDENKGIHIRDVDVKISDVRNQTAKEEVASFVEITITLTL